AILNEINTARKEPEKYIQYLDDYRKLFKGKTAYFPNYLRVQTQEGAVPIEEAIEFMKSLSKLEAYDFSSGLNKSAAAQLGDLIENSSLGHTGKDGSNLSKRLGKFGRTGGRYAENLAFYAETARDVVLLMIVDDGIQNRAHRKNIFSTDFKVIGVAFGKGKSAEGLCVMQFAGSFTESVLPKGVREM
ncbi:MAG: CAP domain-containing protein, partial [Pyrinomonadaceae bacterium]